MAKINDEKMAELKILLLTYKREVEALFGLAHTWKQLSNKAKDVCAKDFDDAIIAREALLEELAKYKSAEIKTQLNEVDGLLLQHSKNALDLYGFQVKYYLNETKKKLPQQE